MSSSVSVEDARRRKILAAACASHALPHDVSMGQVARRKRTHHARRGTYDLLTGKMYRAPPALVLENLTMTSATKMPRTHQSGSS